VTCAELRNVVYDLFDGELPSGPAAEVRAHLDACGDCSRYAEDRRVWSASIGAALRGAAEGIEPPFGARERLRGRLEEASRRGLPAGSRLAAVAAIAVSLGLVAWSLGLRRPTPDQVALAVDRLQTREAQEAELRFLKDEIHKDLALARRAVPAEDPRGRVVVVGSWNLEDRLVEAEEPRGALGRWIAETASADPDRAARARASLRRLDPSRADELRPESGAGDRAFLDQLAADLRARRRPEDRVSVSQTVDGVQVTVTQSVDGTVRVQLPDRTIQAATMAELQSRHADVCRRWSIRGQEGVVIVGGSSAQADLPGRLALAFRAGRWDEAFPWEAFLEGPGRDRVRERLKAQPAAPPPAVRVDVQAIVRDVQARTRQELERNRERLEAELRKLDERLREARELRERARGLRVLAEESSKD
jgi:hypothetical protein